MRLNDLKAKGSTKEWSDKGYLIYNYDRRALKAATDVAPSWIHFGAGNIFRAFPAAVLDRILNQGEYDRGVIVCEGFDYEIIDKAYKPFDSLSLLVILKSDGKIEKRAIGSVTESLVLSEELTGQYRRISDIFAAPSLQMASFTITEKGYAVKAASGEYLPVAERDIRENGLHPVHIMGKLAALLYKRYQAGGYPIAMVSMDNCSHNGDKLYDGILAYVNAWTEEGLVPAEFKDYVTNKEKVSFPWSMIDKITPRPDDKVKEMLEKEGFEDTGRIITAKNTYTAAFVNAEEAEYLIIEDAFPNGRPPLEKGGVRFTNRGIVDKVEKMKVCTCLNPLHTALAIFGCLLGFTSISAEMKDTQLKELIYRIGYQEGLPVVVNPGIIEPQFFLHEVLEKRFPNPFLPDTPQRIAMDTSQKLPIRYGETLKAYLKMGRGLMGLQYIPLVFAGYARYLMGIDDYGNSFEPSPDPMLDFLRSMITGLSIGMHSLEGTDIKRFFSQKGIFGIDLYEHGIGERTETMLLSMLAGTGAVRATLKKYL